MSNKDDLTAALLDELRASREVTAATLTLVAKLTERMNEPAPADPWAKRSEELRKQRDDRPLRSEEIIKDCVSPFTGATYNAKVVDGVVVDLQNYRYPEWAIKRVVDGGQIPNEMLKVSPADPYHIDPIEENSAYLQWRYSSTYQVDLRAIVSEKFGFPRVKGNDKPYAFAETPETAVS